MGWGVGSVTEDLKALIRDKNQAWAALAKPFDVDRVEWKPQATRGDRALAIAYADARAYQDRLNRVAGTDWSDEYEVMDGGAVVLCKLTVCGVTRSDIGEADPSDRNTATGTPRPAH